MAAIGATLSAYFILAANAFMQNPVGYEMATAGSRAELVDFWALLTNPVALAAFPHTITSAWMFAAAVLIAVPAWHLLRKQNIETIRTSRRFGMRFMIISFAGVAVTGDQPGLVMEIGRAHV